MYFPPPGTSRVTGPHQPEYEGLSCDVLVVGPIWSITASRTECISGPANGVEVRRRCRLSAAHCQTSDKKGIHNGYSSFPRLNVKPWLGASGSSCTEALDRNCDSKQQKVNSRLASVTPSRQGAREANGYYDISRLLYNTRMTGSPIKVVNGEQ